MATSAAKKEIRPAYYKLRDIIKMPKNLESLKLLKIWYSEEDADILTAGPFRTVSIDQFTIEDYAEKSNLPVEKVRETFERLSPKGLLFWFRDRKDGDKKKYMIPPLFPGLVEYFIISPNNSIDERREFVKRFHSQENESSMINMVSDFSVFRIVPATKPEPKTRLIEIDKTLQPEKSQILAFEDVEEIIRYAGRYENNIAIMPCTCRTMSMMMKTNPDCEASVENCMCFGAPATFCVEEGIGRYASQEEAIEILKQAEKEGLIHLTSNTKTKQGFICNCCTCCCGIIGQAKRLNFMDLFQESDFVPIIDNDSCKHCKKCIKKCGFNALIYQPGDKEDKSEDKILVREDVCIGCGVCSANCPTDAINLKRIRNNKPAESFMEAIVKMMAGRKAA